MSKGKLATKSASQYKGDDLEDGLELDDEFLAEGSGSGSIDGSSQAGSIQGDVVDDDDEVDGREYLSEDEDARVAAIKKSQFNAGSKRKAAAPGEEMDEETRKAEKKRRKKEREKRRKAKRMQAKSPSSFSRPLAQLSEGQLSELLLHSIRDTFPTASPMEIDDLKIPDANLLPSCQTNEELGENLAALAARIQPFMTDKKIPVGMPRVIIISLSGLRSADVVRAVKTLPGSGEVAKLFAKHLKYDDQVKYLAKTRVSVAVGTPARIAKLLEEGALKINKHSVVLLDASFHDSKQRTILTLPEARTELWKSVFSGQSRKVLLETGVRIGAF